MKNLKKVLDTYRAGVSTAGGEAVREDLQVENLQADLQSLISDFRIRFYILLGLLALLLAGCVIIIIVYLHNPTHIASLFGASGISVGLVVNRMLKLNREHSRSQMLLFLAPNLESDALKGIIEILAQKI